MTARDADEEIVNALVSLARDPARGLLQLRCRASVHQYRTLYRLVRRYAPAGAQVLDWGAGNGHFSFFLARAGYRATGYGFDGDAFRTWLGDPSYHFIAGSATDPVTIPFEAASFDAVASVGVLEHVRETGGTEDASLREIARVLKPGGAFIAYHFPNRTSWIDWAASRVPGKHHHVYRYGAADIVGLVRAAGLDVVALGRYGMLPRNSLDRMLGPLGDAPAFVRAYDGVDAALGGVFAPWCQNWWFVARKPAR
jgi:SAM-dependent methyltransferase